MTLTLPPTDTIDTGQLRHLMAEDPAIRILDVRSGGEFESVHIPGSYNVPLDTLREHAIDLAAVEHPVVLVCQSGGRATQAHATLSGAGKGVVHILEGGMTAWQASGGDVVRADSPRWAMERQVRLVAGALTLTAIAASVLVPKAKWLAAGIGAGLVTAAVTDTCAMAGVLGKIPYNRTDECNIAAVLDELRQEAA